MAVTIPKRRSRNSQSRNTEGRMPLREHLAELRSRLLKAGGAIVLGAIGGWFLYTPLFHALQEPLTDIATARNIDANINFADLASAFNLRLKLAVYIGVVLASPVWLYQVWAFILPGLNRRERNYSLAFVGVAVPLFAGGIYLGWLIIPNAVEFFVTFAPEGTSVLPSADTYFLFVTRLLLVFGIAFLLPLFLVALNLAGVLSAKALARGWRLAVFLIFLFAAIASPSPEVGSMLALAFPMVLLYLLAVAVAFMVDRSRARRSPADELSDDEASPLDETPEPLEAPSLLEAPSPLEETTVQDDETRPL